MHIKMNELVITNIKEKSFNAILENVYSQAKRTNTLKMVKVLLGQVYNVKVTLYHVTSNQMRNIQNIALNSEIIVEFYDERKGKYITQNMYCKTIDKPVKRELSDGTMYYEEINLEFIGNEAVL